MLISTQICVENVAFGGLKKLHMIYTSRRNLVITMATQLDVT